MIQMVTTSVFSGPSKSETFNHKGHEGPRSNASGAPFVVLRALCGNALSKPDQMIESAKIAFASLRKRVC